MNCIIVDDNRIARTTMRQLAGKIKNLQVVGECASAEEAFELLKTEKVDLLLLDIEMPGMSGIELTRELREPRPLIIFTTSKKDYAAEAFDLNVVDYIVKPVTPGRFQLAMEKAEEIYNSSAEEMQASGDEFIFIRDGNIVRRLEFTDINYAEAMGDYVKLHTPSRFYAVHATLKLVEERLPAAKFTRVHRSYIVAVSKIDSIQDGTLIINGKPVPVADSYRAQVNKRLNIL